MVHSGPLRERGSATVWPQLLAKRLARTSDGGAVGNDGASVASMAVCDGMARTRVAAVTAKKKSPDGLQPRGHSRVLRLDFGNSINNTQE